MSSPFPHASKELDYPLYALSFDPENANRLIVGGGGGASRTGVGNKISILETEDAHHLRLAGELELPRDEDSVMSLAFGGNEDSMSYVFAGVNSSPEDIEKGENRHLRCLSIEHSKARASAGDKVSEAAVAELSRSAFFQRPDSDTYQRLLRISGQVGAAASGMGKEPQLAVFDATWPNPKLRNLIELPKDAEELDIIQSGEGEYIVAFCYKYELHLVRLDKTKKNKKSEPELIFTMPDDHGQRPSFRSIRFLTPTFLLAVANLPSRSGTVIQGFRLPTLTQEKARIAASVRVPGKISATALAVANVCPSVPTKNTQFAVAVAANDSSIYLYTVEHKVLHSIEILSNLYPLYNLKNIHNGDSITGVAFSTFTPPITQSTHTQFLRLASITLQKGVAVHSIPLKKHVVDAAAAAAETSKTPEKSTRYVIAMRSKAPSHRSLIITLSVMVLILAIIGQSIMELYGNSRPIVHAHKFFPGLYGSLRNPDYPPEYFTSQEYLISKLSEAGVKPEGETLVIWQSEQPVTAVAPDGEVVVVSDIKLDVHYEDVHGPAKTWEDLSQRQKDAWLKKLKKAGAWSQNMGESVFKGILFGELAGAVGRAMAR